MASISGPSVILYKVKLNILLLAMAQSRISHGKKFGETLFYFLRSSRKIVQSSFCGNIFDRLCKVSFMAGNNVTIEIYSSLSVHGEEKLALNFILNFQCDRWLKLTISGHYIIERRQTGEKSVPGTMMEPFCSESLQGINSSVHVSLHPSLSPPPQTSSTPFLLKIKTY